MNADSAARGSKRVQVLRNRAAVLKYLADYPVETRAGDAAAWLDAG